MDCDEQYFVINSSLLSLLFFTLFTFSTFFTPIKNMKHTKYTILLLAVLSFFSCSEEKLSDESVIVVSSKEKNGFDRWLDANFLNPYNIRFQYRYEETESDYNYYTVPAEMNQAVKLAHIVKYICIDSYSEIAGEDFVKAYFPKQFYLIGEWEYRNNGSYVLGTAEGGKKILLSGVNYVDYYSKNMVDMTDFYLKTIHHEFTHILNQTVPYPTDFQFVTKDSYLASAWNTDPYNKEDYYLPAGFISDYSQQEVKEDFAEMMSMYVCYSEAQWNEWLEKAGEEGAGLIKNKLSIVRRYMKTSWHIDIDELRDIILRRENDIETGKVDLMDLSI